MADVVRLRDADGLPSDAVPYSAAGVPTGVPIERGPDGRWRVAFDPLGTPGRPPRDAPAIAGNFALARPRARAGERAARLAWSLPWTRARISVDAYDLSGARAATLIGETEVSARGESEFAVETLPPGLYVVVLRARSLEADEQLHATQLLRVEGREP